MEDVAPKVPVDGDASKVPRLQAIRTSTTSTKDHHHHHQQWRLKFPQTEHDWGAERVGSSDSKRYPEWQLTIFSSPRIFVSNPSISLRNPLSRHIFKRTVTEAFFGGWAPFFSESKVSDLSSLVTKVVTIVDSFLWTVWLFLQLFPGNCCSKHTFQNACQPSFTDLTWTQDQASSKIPAAAKLTSSQMAPVHAQVEVHTAAFPAGQQQGVPGPGGGARCCPVKGPAPTDLCRRDATHPPPPCQACP